MNYNLLLLKSAFILRTPLRKKYEGLPHYFFKFESTLGQQRLIDILTELDYKVCTVLPFSRDGQNQELLNIAVDREISEEPFQKIESKGYKRWP